MARKALGPATLAVVQALEAVAATGGHGWLVACSGGADSLALAWAATHVGLRRRIAVRALVVDHRLQTGSDAVAARAVETLAGFGLDAEVTAVTVADAGAGPEASARKARYAALAAAARPGERILLGHTLDDQAETVLLALARGSGIGSLQGMRVERDALVRPLLGLGRETTTQACAELGFTPWQDPMNTDHRYARVRVRDVVLPVLERELGPGIREGLARTAQASAAAHDLVAGLADEVACGQVDDCHYLRGLAPAVRAAVITRWLRTAGASDVASSHVHAVERLVVAWRGQKGVDVPGGRVVRRDGRLVLEVGRLR